MPILRHLSVTVAAALACLWLALAAPALASQATLVTPGAPLPMTGLASFLNSAFLSIGSLNSGTTAPANGTGAAPFSYESWCNTTANPTVCNVYDGANWVEFGTLDTTAHRWTPFVGAAITSGGVPYGASAGTIGWSAALAQNGFMVGGGASAAPSAIAACTNGQLPVGVTSAAPACQTMGGDVSSVTAAGAVTLGKLNGVTYPSAPSVNTVPVVTSAAGGGTVTYEAVPNAALANSSITIGIGSGVGLSTSGCGPASLGGTCTLSATTDTVQWASLGLGGAAPATGARIYNALVNPGANGQLALGASATNGGVVAGQGSTNDLTFANKSGTTVCSVATGGTTINCATLTLTNPLTVAYGGTGDSSLTTHGVLVGEGTSPVTVLSAAAAGTVLTGQGASSDPSFSATPTLGVAGTTLGTLGVSGSTSGVVTIQPQAVAGTFNFNLPTSAGSANQVLTSQGGAASAQTYQNIASLLTAGTGITISGTTNATVALTTPVSIANGGTSQTTANAARQSSGLDVLGDQGTAHGDANVTIGNTERMAYTNAALTAARTWTLPAANVTGAPYTILIVDLAGGATATNTITVQRAGADTVNGGTTVVAINLAFGAAACSSDGSSIWDCQPFAGGGGGAGTVTSVACGGVTITVSGTCPPAFGFQNCSLAATVASNNLTVALKDNAGADPTATSPCTINFRNVTAATGSWSQVSQTAALSFTASSGSTFGVTNTSATCLAASSCPFRLWVVAINNAGSIALGVVDLTNASGVRALNESALQSTTACSACTTATSIGTIYSTAAQTGKAIAILGYLEWGSGLATAGTYASGPTIVQSLGRGVKKPGESISTINTFTTSVATDTSANMPGGSATLPTSSEGSQAMSLAYNPVSPADLLIVSSKINVNASVASFLQAALFSGSTLLDTIVTNPTGSDVSPISTTLQSQIMPGSGSVTYSTRFGLDRAGTATFNELNGLAATGWQSNIVINEIQG